MALLSAFQPAGALSEGLFRVFMVAGGIGTILTAGYFLWMLQRVNMGTVPERWAEASFDDVLPIEWAAWAPLLVGIVLLGLYPKIVFAVTDGPVEALVRLLGA